MENFAGEAIDFTNCLVGAIAPRVDGKIPGAGVVDYLATKRFFVLRETVPGVFFIFGGGDAPKVENFSSAVFGIKNHLHKQNSTSGKFTLLIASGSMSVKAHIIVIVHQGSG